jgi:polyhydroxyalkanoate synthesis regulator phasin
MEYSPVVDFSVTGGELFDELVKRGSFSEADARDVAFQVVTGIQVFSRT